MKEEVLRFDRVTYREQGVTELSQVQFIERGYEDLVGKLRAV